KLLFLDVVIKRANDFVENRMGGQLRGPNLAWARVVDEFIQLRGHFVGFMDDVAGFFADLRLGLGPFGNHLRQTTDDVERVAGFVSETGSGDVHFLEVGIQLAGAKEPKLERKLATTSHPGEAGTD